MIPIVSIVGKSKAGKTNLLERLIPELKGRGYRMAVVKHMGQDFELDYQGKDSWRLIQAGAEVVILSSAKKLATVRLCEQETSLEELSHLIGIDFDLILTEGYKQGKGYKIEVHRKELGNDLICPWEELSAVVSDEPLNIPITQFHTNDVKGIADFIENKFLGKRQSDVALFVNDKSIPLNPFVKEFFARTLLGMISALKGVKEIRKIEIWLRQKGEEKQ